MLFIGKPMGRSIMISNAGRAMPCIKLLPLPPPCGSHWLVGGFQQCRVCILSCCCSLSLARRLPCRVVVSDVDDENSRQKMG